MANYSQNLAVKTREQNEKFLEQVLNNPNINDNIKLLAKNLTSFSLCNAFILDSTFNAINNNKESKLNKDIIVIDRNKDNIE
jgi:hypothetical protein